VLSNNTERVCKPGLLDVEATVKGFTKPWKILIDSGASGNYARCSTMEGSQQYAEALKARTSDVITVRLATGTRVTVPKVAVNLAVKFLDFDSLNAVWSSTWIRGMTSSWAWHGWNAMSHGSIGGRRP
jgi:hypothetical protein